jgi:plastocyanin
MEAMRWTLISVVFLCFSVNADLTGTVKFEGKVKPPREYDLSGIAEIANLKETTVKDESMTVSEAGELKNVVVSIKREAHPDLKGEAPKTPVILDQRGFVYRPHVLALQIGQELIVKNSDPLAHNIHTMPDVNTAENKVQDAHNDGEKLATPTKPEIYTIECDMHPWMQCWVAVFDHPFFAISDDKGNFSIKGLPPGQYTMVAWHEKLGTIEGKTTIDDKGNGTIGFAFKDEQ